MQRLHLVDLWPEQCPSQGGIALDFPLRRNPSNVQLWFLSVCCLCTSKAAMLAQERGTLPSSFEFPGAGEISGVGQLHLYHRCTVRACFCRVGVAVSSTGGSVGCCPHDSTWGDRGHEFHILTLSGVCKSVHSWYYYQLAPHSSTLAWKIPWTEEPGGLQTMGSLSFGHD